MHFSHISLRASVIFTEASWNRTQLAEVDATACTKYIAQKAAVALPRSIGNRDLGAAPKNCEGARILECLSGC